MNWKKNVLLGLAVTSFFSVLLLFNVFSTPEDQVYDLFLRFRAQREREPVEDITFLDVDDAAIQYNGVFPWPRSITADALLRLKEYGARAAIFDIEYIDKGPPGVDIIHLNQRLPGEFAQSFSDINSQTVSAFSALRDGRMGLADLEYLEQYLSGLVNDEHNRLFSSAQAVARDNDVYLFQASALFGRSWATLHLREPFLTLSEEQEARRPLAEELFAYRSAASTPLKASPNAVKGDFTAILPSLTDFARAAEGAGFVNAVTDSDGTRRRIALAQNVHEHWYLQLAFAPLMKYLGNPELELDNRTMRIKGARMPDGELKDITIPLDGRGNMLLDWPKEDYLGSYRHVSFQDFSLLEHLEAEMELYALAFADMQISFFAQMDPSLERIPYIVNDLTELFMAAREYKTRALESASDEDFNAFIDFRAQTRALIDELLEIGPGAKASALVPELTELFPDNAEGIIDEAEYISNVADNLAVDLERYLEISGDLKGKVEDKFCILGRTDWGSTDFGKNPFFGRYVNVGTHGVVLDMILSESFIASIDTIWRVLFTLVFVFLFFLVSAKLMPVTRVISGFLAIVVVIVAAAFLLRFAGIFVNPLLVTMSMVVAVILREIISYAGSEREKEFIRKAFSTYVSDDVVNELIADPSRLQLGGTKRYMSAFFTDVQGFSGISEKLDPESLVSLLNRYLTFMSDAILEEKGTIDKYEGDAIVAFFGAPLEVPDHALRACNAAIAIKRIEIALNRKIMDEKISPSPLLTRVGINTGNMVAGNMGTGNKMNYTIMGNAVNLASRLEGANKQYGTWILAAEDTIRETGEEILSRRIDRVRLVGINEPVQLYEIITEKASAKDSELKLVEAFHQALDYYYRREWEKAMQGFRESYEIERKGPSIIYFNRCKSFLNHPPHDNWDGIHILTEK